MEENTIRWSGYEYEHKEKTTDWFWAISIIAICLSAIAIIYSNFLFGIFILIAAITMMILAKNKPDIIEFVISPKGIIINKKLYMYSNLRSFWVETHGSHIPTIFIKTKHNLHGLFIIPLETDAVDPNDIRDYLLQALPEEHIHEPISHRFMKFLGL